MSRILINAEHQHLHGVLKTRLSARGMMRWRCQTRLVKTMTSMTAGRSLAASHWTAATIGAFLVGLHVIWFARSEHQGDVISGFGVAIAVLGAFVTAQPFIRKGVRTTARQDVGLHQPSEAEAEEVEKEAMRHVMKERVFGAVLIAIGTLLNGYAGALAHLFDLKGP